MYKSFRKTRTHRSAGHVLCAALATGIALLSLNACHEKAVFDDQDMTMAVFRVSQFEQMPFPTLTDTKGSVADSVCRKLHYVFFQNGEREEIVTQNAGDEGFGTLSRKLSIGEHQVIVVAHNGDGNATITSLDKAEFSNNKNTAKVTDTFLFYETVEVTRGGANSFPIALQRVVAKFRLEITDSIPAAVSRLYFTYSGGSQSLNPQTGKGATKSTQKVEIPVTAGNQIFEIYTFPREDSNSLKVTVAAYDALGNKLKEREFENVPIRRNNITVYKGDFFSDGVSSYDDGQFSVSFTGLEWSESVPYDFNAQ